ncbi:hypothetical protein GGC63_000835 [Paenibacillus sp. OAS669]|nr:hypothetical protein [Paenibacillus sp. OAS669]
MSTDFCPLHNKAKTRSKPIGACVEASGSLEQTGVRNSLEKGGFKLMRNHFGEDPEI